MKDLKKLEQANRAQAKGLIQEFRKMKQMEQKLDAIGAMSVRLDNNISQQTDVLTDINTLQQDINTSQNQVVSTLEKLNARTGILNDETSSILNAMQAFEGTMQAFVDHSNEAKETMRKDVNYYHDSLVHTLNAVNQQVQSTIDLAGKLDLTPQIEGVQNQIRNVYQETLNGNRTQQETFESVSKHIEQTNQLLNQLTTTVSNHEKELKETKSLMTRLENAIDALEKSTAHVSSIDNTTSQDDILKMFAQWVEDADVIQMNPVVVTDGKDVTETSENHQENIMSTSENITEVSESNQESITEALENNQENLIEESELTKDEIIANMFRDEQIEAELEENRSFWDKLFRRD